MRKKSKKELIIMCLFIMVNMFLILYGISKKNIHIENIASTVVQLFLFPILPMILSYSFASDIIHKIKEKAKNKTERIFLYLSTIFTFISIGMIIYIIFYCSNNVFISSTPLLNLIVNLMRVAIIGFPIWLIFIIRQTYEKE